MNLRKAIFLSIFMSMFIISIGAMGRTTPYPSHQWGTFKYPHEIPGTPRGIVVHPDNKRAYVVAEFDDAVYEIDTNGNILRTLKFDDYRSDVYEPKFIVINSAGTKLYVTCYTSESVFIIDIPTFSVIDELRKIEGYHFYNPAGIAISKDDAHIFVADTGETYDNGLDCLTGNDRILKISTTGPTYTVEAEKTPGAVGAAYYDLPAKVIISNDGTKLFVGIYGCDMGAKHYIFVFNTSDLSTLTAIDCNVSGQPDHLRPLGMDLTQDNYLYIVSEYRARLIRIDVRNLPSYSVDWYYDLGTVNEADPRDVKIMHDNSTGNEYIFASISGNEEQTISSYTIKVFKHGDPPTFVQDITTPYRAPESMAISSDGTFLFVSHWDRHAVTVWSKYERVPTISIGGFLAVIFFLTMLFIRQKRRKFNKKSEDSLLAKNNSY